MSRPQLVDDAQAAAGRGWRVFPLVPGRKQPRKAATDWETSATTSPERIARWWAGHPADNVAVATGPSGLVVVDLDVPRPGDTPPPPWAGCASGADVLDRLARSAGAHVPATFTVATPSGGRHLYYAAPGGAPLRNTSGRAGWKVDTRAAGGYVVAAGSELPAGRYELVDDRPPVALPGWLARLLAPPTPARPPAPRRPPSRRRGYVAAALAGEVARVLDAGPGARNDALNRAAWNLGRHVAAGSLARQLVEDALTDAATAAGYRDGPNAAGAVIRAALDARLNRPHTHREATP